MKEKSLKVIYNSTEFTVMGADERIQDFLNWVAEYKKGDYNVSENIVFCSNPNALRVCSLKALRMNIRVDMPTTK